MTHDSATLGEQYNYYEKNDFWVLAKLKEFIATAELQPFSSCFARNQYSTLWAFVNRSGIQKLRNEYPTVLDEFSISDEDAQMVTEN